VPGGLCRSRDLRLLLDPWRPGSVRWHGSATKHDHSGVRHRLGEVEPLHETTRCSLRGISAMGAPLAQLSHPARLWEAASH
jgi:hypothetical protein